MSKINNNNDFIKSAQNRMKKVVKSIRAQINTEKKPAYDWSDVQGDKILFILTSRMTQLENTRKQKKDLIYK